MGNLTIEIPPINEREGTSIFVCGPNADSFRAMNGGWTYAWQGHMNDRIAREIGGYRTFYEALAEKFGKENGENSYTETPGNIDDLNLSANQTTMVEALAATESVTFRL